MAEHGRAIIKRKFFLESKSNILIDLTFFPLETERNCGRRLLLSQKYFFDPDAKAMRPPVANDSVSGATNGEYDYFLFSGNVSITLKSLRCEPFLN
ncbi:MAG: hypothetical protein HY525_04130 [Betaproteobacteria bacterium]|nr:hypothetical protein [Betaproteobacteria bacterium]